ncbi:hypothetical protein Tco_0973998 [Tanacetum coccineum]|uniref:Uncharacterized protein n=1 Tax=Tanacetum coccineum TaxID=301880 RepID=A0ABQ5EAG9_9ASTR
MNTPITFPPVLADDVLDEPLIIEAEVEGYLVRKVFVDHGAAVQVMFEHCFDNLPSSVKARLTLTQPELVGFSREQQLIPIGKVKLEVAFGSEGIYRRMIMKFTVKESEEEEVLINPAFPKQKVTIGAQFSKECRLQLINLLKDNMDVFA